MTLVTDTVELSCCIAVSLDLGVVTLVTDTVEFSCCIPVSVELGVVTLVTDTVDVCCGVVVVSVVVSMVDETNIYIL